MRTVKERCRTIIHFLPFALERELIAGLALFVVKGINREPMRTAVDRTLPVEQFTGVRTHIRELRAGYASYAQAVVPRTTNSMEERTM